MPNFSLHVVFAEVFDLEFWVVVRSASGGVQPKAVEMSFGFDCSIWAVDDVAFFMFTECKNDFYFESFASLGNYLISHIFMLFISMINWVKLLILSTIWVI